MATRLGSPFADELGAIPFSNPQSPVITPAALGVFQPSCDTCTADFPVTNGPVTWSIAAGSLPTGFTLGDGSGPDTGRICGTPVLGDVGSTFSFTIQATNAAGSGFWATSLSIASWIVPNIDETSPPTSPATAGVAYSSAIFDETNTQCSTWSIVSGSLPPGLTISSGFEFGDISGTPTTGGSYTFTVREENPAGFNEVAFTIVVTGGGTGGTATPSAIARTVVVPAGTETGGANTSPSAIARTVVVPAPTAIGALPVWAGSDPTTYSQTAAFEIGTNVFVTSSVQVVGVRIWNPGLGARTSRSAKLWEMAGTSFTGGTNVREVTLPDQMPTGWSYYLFATPYTAITTKYFVVSYDVGGFGLNDIGHVFQTTQTDSADGKVHYASNPGCYTSTPDTTPTINFISEFWGIDVLYVGDGSGTATPSTVPLSVSTPAPATSGGSNVSPAAIARTVVVPAPTATGSGAGDGTATPSAIARTVVVPAPTARGGSGATPSAIPLTVVTPAPTVSGGGANPAAIALHATVPTPSASGSHVFPAAIALHATVPTPFVTGTFPIGTYIPVGRVRLYDRTGATLVASLESAFDIEWQDVDNGTGLGKFKLALSDPDSLLITLGQVVYCDLYDRSNVFSFIVEQYPQMRIQSQEELGQVMEISGRGTAAIMDTAVCYPFDGVNAVPVRSVRSFSFASQDYTETVDWVPAVAIAQQGDMTTYWIMTLPETTHLTSAPGAWPTLPIIPYWIWSQVDNSVIGKSYFRETFFTAAAANVEIIATGDNYWTLYLDGVPILGDNEFQEAWQEHRSVSMLLPAGNHTVAAVVNNVFVAGLVGNPGGFLMAILIPHEGEGVEPDLMLLSDTGWNALAYPAREPGFTPGGIILALIDEAQNRFLLLPVTCSFTATHDSGGVAWETIPEFGVNIGASLLNTLEQLTNDGWVEWSMTASGWVLEMWAPGGRGVASGVTFADEVNIGEATYEAAHTIVNRLLVSYGKGLFAINDVGSQITWGVYEGFLTLDTPDLVEATRLANKSMATSADDELAVTMRIEPDGASPDRPYVNFVVGDTVTGPGELGVARTYEVLGITITLDLMGDPVISLEMNRRVRNPEEVRVNLLQTLGSAVTGTAPGSRPTVFENDGPYYRTRTPTTGDVKSATPPAPGEVVFTVPGTVDTTGTSPRWVTPYRFLIYQVIMAVTTVSTGDIIIRVLGTDFTLPAGQEHIEINSELHRDSANSFTVSLTDVGGGDATGLTVTLRYRYYTGLL